MAQKRKQEPPADISRLLEKKLVLFGGKGGVGKTSCASAFAYLASSQGKRCL
ncbi:MAG: hypothetical protein OEZ36_12005, partial [Spirochaetota bacterium]|nr:hypothetical protein [Spirochaetota bacterium]